MPEARAPGAPALRHALAVLALCMFAPFVVAAEPGAAFTEAPYLLVRDGRARGALFLSPEAGKAEADCAVYLQNWIQNVAGAKPEIVRGNHDAGPGIRLVLNPRGPGEGFGDGSFRFDVPAHGRLTICADTPEGLRAGAACFVEKALGVKFLMPGEFGADWKPLRAVPLPTEGRRAAPAFAWRAFSGMETPAEREWAADNGLGALPAMNHALHEVFDAKAFSENPAMFPTLGGKITGPSGRGGYEPQPNLANPDSAKHAAKRAFEFFQKNPDAPTFSLSINDNMTWDESPESKAALGSGKYFRNRPDYSDYVFGFMNRTAAALREADSNPGARGSAPPEARGDADAGRSPALPGTHLLTSYAYYHCENTPSFPVESRVFPILTVDRSEWRDPAFANEDAALMARWSKSGVRAFGIYDYYYGRPMAAPRVFLKAEAESLRCAAKSGATLFFAELEPDWGFDGPKAWLAAKLLRNPDADPDALLDSYYDAAYGPAAPAMRRFFAIVESRWAQRAQPPRWIRFFREESVAELFPPSVRRELRAALDAAERAFPKPTPDFPDDGGRTERRRLRVRASSVSFAKTEAFLKRYDLQREIEAAPVARDEEAAKKILGLARNCELAELRYHEACGRWNRCGLNSGGQFEPEMFWPHATAATVAEKCGVFAKILPAEASRGVPSSIDAAVLAEKPPAGVDTVFRDGFERESFRPAKAGGWAAAKGLTLPREPWKTNLFEAERTRFGYSEAKAFSGTGSLRVGGGDLARISRRVGVFSGDTVGVRFRYTGKIIPGEHLGIGIRFLGSEGAPVSGVTETVAFPGVFDDWRTLALSATAPEGATHAEVTVHFMNQDRDSDVWADDFEIRLCPAGGPEE